MSLPSYNKKHSYHDYLNWSDEDERIEIIDGIPYNMSPAPSTTHQQVSMQLSYQLMSYFNGSECKVFSAPFDVRLFTENKKDDEIFNIVQPDITVICDKKKLDSRGVNGSPDFVIEIISPSTAKMDKIIKRNIYEKAGIMEYWIADPQNNLIEIYQMTGNGRYNMPLIYSKEDTIESTLFQGLKIYLGDVF